MPYDAKAPKMSSKPPESGSNELSAFGEYADDVLAAIKSGDRAAFKTALKAAVKACYADEG